MLYESKKITIKDGIEILLRNPQVSDALALIHHLKTVTLESFFTLRSFEEYTETKEEQEKKIRDKLQSPTTLQLIIEIEGVLAGNCQLIFNNRKKTAHRASLGIALKKKYWHLGIGTAVIKELINIAKQHNVIQLELETLETNTNALGLYHKMGFEIYAKRPDAIKLPDGNFYAEYFMLKKI